MKPYGQKHGKSLLNIHPADYCAICSNDGWKVIKGRERHNNEEIDDLVNYVIERVSRTPTSAN